MGRAGQFLLITLLLSLAASVWPDLAHSETRCLGWSPVRRTGSDRCWAEASTVSGGKLCFSKALWSSWLDSRPSGRECLDVKLRERVSSFPHNLPQDPPKILRISEEIRELHARPTVPDRDTRLRLLLREKIWLKLERWRERVGKRLERADPTGVFRALLLQQAIPGSPLGIYRLLGFVHLATAAGVHIYAIHRIWLSFVFRIASLFGLSPRRSRAFSEASAWLWTMLAWALSGFRLGLLRPWLVICMRSAAESLGLRFRRYAPLTLSLTLDLLIGWYRGEALTLHSGRWIYALAVGGALTAWDGPRASPFRTHARMAVRSWVATAVLEAWVTGLCAPLTPILSLVTLPLFCSFLYPLLFFDSLLPMAAVPELLRVSSLALEGMLAFTLKASALWLIPHWALLVGAGGGALIAAFGSATERPRSSYASLKWGALVVALTAFGATLIPTPRSSEVLQLDVGQGDAAWVRSEHTGLIDTGPPGALRPEKWIALLASESRTHLDWVALTHLDQDHSGGLLDLARLVPIGCVELSPAEEASGRGQTLANSLRSLGVRAGTGCVPIPVLHPAERTVSSKANARMSAYLVPLVSRGIRVGSYLSTGDSSVRDEPRFVRWALDQGWNRYPHRIFKLGHHGSRTSSAPETLRLLHPSEIWISAGAGNRYGHPHPMILERVLEIGQEEGVKLRRTDRNGALGSPSP